MTAERMQGDFCMLIAKCLLWSRANPRSCLIGPEPKLRQVLSRLAWKPGIPPMASDSSSSTPMVLTPESTGSDSISVKKKRRQTAFYPNTVSSGKKPQNPFSRSAAKRESVMALGSIEHLQHYFTKTGIVAKDGCVRCHITD
jgi:hypothetical protein